MTPNEQPTDPLEPDLQRIAAALYRVAREEPAVIEALERVVARLRQHAAAESERAARSEANSVEDQEPNEEATAPASTEEDAELPSHVLIPAPSPDEPTTTIAPWREVEVDLALVARRARLKAETLAWVARRRSLFGAVGVDYRTQVESENERLHRAGEALNDCKLWMLAFDGASGRLSELELEELGRAYECVALAADAALRFGALDPPPVEFPELVQLLAEAQSALRRGLVDAQVGITRDADQFELWCWLRQETDRRRIRLERHMRLDDGAEAAGLADFPERLERTSARIEGREQRARERASRINQLRYHVKRIDGALDLGTDPEDPGLAHDWRKIAGVLDQWVRAGNAVTDDRLLSTVAAIVDDFPEAYLLVKTGPVLDAAETWQDARVGGEVGAEGAEDPETDVPSLTSAEVLERAPAAHTGRLVFALNSRSDPSYDYSRPRELEAALEWLATTYRDVRLGTSDSMDHRALSQDLMEHTGWFYRGRQSASTIGQFANWYRCTHGGEEFELQEHIGRGNTKRQGRHSIRIAFAWDGDAERVVIGFVGQHQRTTQS